MLARHAGHTRRPVMPNADLERRGSRRCSTGYWAFGQYWGIWVILVMQVQSVPPAQLWRMGMMLALLSLVAIIVMAFVAPRLAQFPLGALCATGLLALGTGSHRDGVAPLVRAVVRVRHRRGRQRARRRLPQRGRPARRVDHAIGPCSSGCTPPMPSAGSPAPASAGLVAATHTNFRVGLLFGGVCSTWPRSGTRRRGRRERGATEVDSGVLAHGVQAPPRALAAGARGPVRVPGGRARWTRGRGCT